MVFLKEKKQINVAVSGSFETDTGQKTSTIVEQIHKLPGINLNAFFNKDRKIAERVLVAAGILNEFEYSSSKEPSVNELIYTDDYDFFLSLEEPDVFIITEINASAASEIVSGCLGRGKKVVNLNAISEVTLGLLFKKLAIEKSTIYSVGAGDEPAATLELINYCNMLGLETICAGKGKNNPLNIYANPGIFEKKGREMNVSPLLIASFVDGTKTMLEMAILSNATGFKIDRTGMHGPEANVKDLVKIFDLKKNGGVLANAPVIDFAIGDIAPGVFVVFTSTQESILDELRYLKMGTGPNFLLYKPYHLGNIEAPLSIYDLMLYEKPSLVIKDSFITMVAVKAKKDLKKGERLDYSGGYSFYAVAVDYGLFEKMAYVPIGLAEGSKVIEDIKKDSIIKYGQIEINENSSIAGLWEEQQKYMR